MKNLVILLLLFFTCGHLGAQPNIQWQKCIGGSSTEDGASIRPTADGGYIVCGQTMSADGDMTGKHNAADCWVAKLSHTGSTEWEKTLGGNGEEGPGYIQQTADGGFILTTFTISNDGDVSGNHGSEDYWVVKLSATGNIEWQKTLGGSDIEEPHFIQQTEDGGYFVAGYTVSVDDDVTNHHGSTPNADGWVVKLDASGNIVWQKTLGGSGADGVFSARQTTDNGYILSGYSTFADGDVSVNNGKSDFWIVKLSDTGSIEWQKSMGGSEDDFALYAQQTLDGGYIAAGLSYSDNGDVVGHHGNSGINDGWVIKLSASGTVQWQRALGGSAGDDVFSLVQNADSSYTIAGSTESGDGDLSGISNTNNNLWIAELSASGTTIQWQKCFGGSGSDVAESISLTPDKYYIISGQTTSNDGDVSGNHGGYDAWIVKLGGPLGVNTINNDRASIGIAPNPTTDKIIITGVSEVDIKIYNSFGKIVKEANNAGSISLASLPDGVYYISLFKSGQRIYQGNILKNQ
ncbi:T9SS type A sorting domain-containing protein [Chitinophagaceae bacterium MMS25-I14]